MKKLLLLSVLCFSVQIRTEEVQFSDINEVQQLLEDTTPKEIEDEIKSIIDPVTSELRVGSDIQGLWDMKVIKLGFACRIIINLLDAGKQKNLNPDLKENLKQSLPLCARFFSQSKEAFNNSSVIEREKVSIIADITKLEKRATELLEKK